MKCKACGFNDSVKYNPRKRIVSLLTERSKVTQKILRNVIKLINRIPSQKDADKQFYFLQAISKIDEQIIKLAIHSFILDERHTKGKGFAYLRTIMLNRNNNMDTLKKNERLLIGGTPPVIETK